MRRVLPHGLLAIIVCGLYLTGVLRPVDNALSALRFRLAQRPASGDVAIVAIDPPSLQVLDSWPWPRGYHATVIENLLGAGARRVALDVDFSSRSVPDEDAALAGALAASRGKVILPVFRQWQDAGAGRGELITTRPLPAFARDATLATINIQPDSDGLVRTYWAEDMEPGSAIRSMAATLESRKNIPDRFQIDFGIDAEGIPRISFADVLTGQFDQALVRGKAVIVGATAVELGDQVVVPLGRVIPGPVMQALAFESLAQGRALHRVHYSVIVLFTLLIGLGLGMLVESASWRAGLAMVALLAPVIFALSLFVQKGSPVLLDIAPWGITLIGSYAIGLTRRIDQQGLRLLLEAARARRTENLMRRVVETSFDAILIVDDRGDVRRLNPAAEQMFGYAVAQVVGLPVARLVRGGLPGVAPAADQTATFRPSGPQQGMGITRRGSAFPVEMTVTRIDEDGREMKVAFVRDITQRKAQEQALEYQATHDALTGLPNRVLLRDRVEKALQKARSDSSPVAFLILDLDGFKEINDTLGHHVGDQLLRKIAQRLRVPLRKTETIARLGGDEFAILLPATGVEAAAATARRLTNTLSRPFALEGLNLQVDASIGIALYPTHGSDASNLIQRADVAMSVAKKTQSVVCFYDPEFDFNSVRHLTLKGELRRALTDKQLLLYYQPKIDAGGGQVIGVEALIRWQHPEHGLVPPDEFIGMAEHTGLIRPITRWVLREALTQCAGWEAMGMILPVSVNLSTRNLLERNLPQLIEKLLEETGVSPERLTLEITETAIVEDPQRAIDVITRVAALGPKISIDDFGTGFSSLGYLKNFPAAELKIDKSFVMGVGRDQGDEVIVRSTIDLAHNLGMKATAEGVESFDAWTYLQNLGCDCGQGYYFSRPLPAQDLLEWLRTSPWGRRAMKDNRVKVEAEPVLV